MQAKAQLSKMIFMLIKERERQKFRKIKMHSCMYLSLEGEKPQSHASEKNITALSTELEVSTLHPDTVYKR